MRMSILPGSRSGPPTHLRPLFLVCSTILLAGTCLGGLYVHPDIAAAQGDVALDGTLKTQIAATSKREQPIPWAVQKGIVFGAADVRLPAPDLSKILLGDEALLEQSKTRRIGVRRDLPVPIVMQQGSANAGRWMEAGDAGQLWSVTLESEGAQALRVHLDHVRLPSGSRLWVYAPEDPDHPVGPVSSEQLRGGEAWTPSIFAARVTLELDLPPSASRQDVDLRITEIVHVYVPLQELAPAVPKVDTCYNDATCDPVWINERDGVALIFVVTPQGMVQCTGCLLNDYDTDTWVDYFLTANHCLSGNNADPATQTAASTMEFYWFFHTPTCNGTPPALGTVPRTTGGADLLHHATANAGNDVALVRMRNESPGGVFYMGWTTGSPPIGEDTAGIHHPDGTFARISYGDLDNSTANYWLNVWNSGSTEGGSSGSPLMDSNRRVIGQLQGGTASCSAMSNPDYYGRWNVTYPNVARWFELGGTIHVDGTYSGVEEGTPTKPFNTVGEAHTFAWNGARIQVEAGSYPEPIVFTKEVVVIGAGGIVTIGD